MLANIRAAKKLAASAHSESDKYSKPTTKRAWNNKGTAKSGGGRDSWTSNGKGEPKRKRRCYGKGSSKLLDNSSIPSLGTGEPSPEPCDWDEDEAQRQVLVGPDAPLWTTAPRLALALAASIPSGRASVVSLRNQLQQLMCGGGMLPFVVAERSGDPVVVVHHGVPDASPPTFDFIYVGTWESRLQPTPWSCPIRRTIGDET